MTKESINENSVGMGLRVVAGTVSLDMGFNAGPISEEEGLNLMSQIAQEFVAEIKNQ